MKVSVTYLYAIQTYGYPPGPADEMRAIDDIASMGFHYLEMESLGPEHGRAVWEDRRELKRRLDGAGIHVHNFCGVDPDLVALDDSTRRSAYERFKRTAELGVFLDAETLHLASYAPPVEYVGAAPYQLGQDYAFGDALHVRIPEGFSWPRVWDVLVESCQATADIAGEFDRTIIMEPRVGETICSVDAMLRLIEHVGRYNFKANFDTAHFSAARENIPLALMKLEGRYANIHVADNNPADANHLPVGRGVIDWEEFFRVLGRHGYDGYLGLDLGRSHTLADDLRESLDALRAAAGRVGLRLDS